MCQNIVRESLRDLVNKQSAMDVYDTMADYCKRPENFIRDDPLMKHDSMVAACDWFMKDWTDELEDLLINRKTHDFKELSTYFCGDGKPDPSVTRSCFNIHPHDDTLPIPEHVDEGPHRYPYHFYHKEKPVPKEAAVNGTSPANTTNPNMTKKESIGKSDGKSEAIKVEDKKSDKEKEVYDQVKSEIKGEL